MTEGPGPVGPGPSVMRVERENVERQALPACHLLHETSQSP